MRETHLTSKNSDGIIESNIIFNVNELYMAAILKLSIFLNLIHF